MFKKVLFSLSIITAVGAAGILGTQALLQDQAVLSANTFSTGTANLQIAKDDTAYLDQVEGFNDQLNPGETKGYFFWLNNNNSGFEMGLAAQAASISLSPGLTGDKVSITFVPVQDGANVTDGTIVGPYTLDQLASVQSLPIDHNLSNNEHQRYRMDVSMSSAVTTSSSVSFNLNFTGTQVVVPTPTPVDN